MLVPVPRAGRTPATDFTVLASLVGGLLIWLVLASYALGRSQRLAVLHLQQDVAHYVAGALSATPRAPADVTVRAPLDAPPELTRLARDAGLALVVEPAEGATVLAVIPGGEQTGGRSVAIVRAVEAPGTGMAPGRRELLQLFVAMALAATCLLGALLLLRLHRQHLETSARTDFVRVVSHELRTPLSQILMFAETVRLGRTRSDTERTFALDVILQEARRLGRLVDNVLRFTRLEQGGLALRQDVLNVTVEVKALADQFAPAGWEGHAAHSPLVFVAAHDAYAIGDRDALRQVLVNLIDNGFKHGGRTGQVRVSVRTAGNRVEVGVEDEGPGIADADREHIWAAFGRGPSAGSTSGNASGDTGTGLGLHIVRGLVTAMDGSVRCETPASGRGARFVLTLRGYAPAAPFAQDAPAEAMA